MFQLQIAGFPWPDLGHILLQHLFSLALMALGRSRAWKLINKQIRGESRLGHAGFTVCLLALTAEPGAGGHNGESD
ncbi:hypothetical protein ElyMa_001233100 [Elysia marginata]|uniref:Uncharacterized protein n=1 Tax=Elysia marginata TaxID=1093978 RepID=A0AAV4I8I9_9GAST|nr:hypothetical protein ElyMa_001233100 [Elysia marginata]